MTARCCLWTKKFLHVESAKDNLFLVEIFLVSCSAMMHAVHINVLGLSIITLLLSPQSSSVACTFSAGALHSCCLVALHNAPAGSEAQTLRWTTRFLTLASASFWAKGGTLRPPDCANHIYCCGLHLEQFSTLHLQLDQRYLVWWDHTWGSISVGGYTHRLPEM